MNRGTIKIKETEHHRFVVEVKTADGNLWLTKHEIADLFNVTISSISNCLYSIFKSGILQERDVTQIHLFNRNGKPCQTTHYNLEALILVSCRIASGEAQAFRNWVKMAIEEYLINGQNFNKKEIVIECVFGGRLKSNFVLNLN